MYRKLRALMPLVLLVGLALASVSDAALVGWWKFDDGSGEVAKDSSGKGYHGTITNPLWVAGHYGGALNFEGTSYVDVPPESWSTIERQATVSFWAYGNPDLQPQANFIFGAFSDPANNEARRMSAHVPWSDGTIYFDTGGPSYNRINKAGSATDYEGTWTFWTFLKNADTGDQQVYINGELWHSGTGMTNTMEGVTKFTIGTKPSLAEGWYQGMIDDFRLYDHALTLEEIQLAMTGRGPGLELASDPVPENEATDIPRDVVLSWGAGEYAATHDVYFGASFDDVNAASRSNPMGLLASQAQAATSYDPPGRLDFGTTYYWRVDEVNAAPDNTIFKGEVWSFTTEPFAYPIANVVATSNGTSDATAGPQNTVNGSGLDAADQHSTVSSDMWLATPGTDPLWIQFEFDRVYKLHEMRVWNSNSQFELILGFGIKGVTVDYSENGTDWTALGDFEFARATAKPTYTANTTVDLGGIPARFVRLNVNGGWGTMGQYGLSEVRFLYVPAQAREPQPADGAMDVEVGTALAWRSGREAVSHQVYLGTDADALTLAGTVDVATFAPTLEFGSTYYWQVDEVNEADAVTTWAGDLWSFSTQEYALIDGFETYNDDVDAKTTIFDTWLDGWVNETGSTVGYLNAPFAEKTIVRTGTQSMPLAYDNSGSPFYSEAWREFETAQDWSGNGADTLVLYVRGNAPGFVEAADGAIIMNGIGTDIWNNGDQFRYAYKSLSGNGSMTVRVDSIALSNEWAKAGVMIRETLEAGSKHAFVALTPTPSHGLSFQRRPTADAASANTDVADIALPHWVKLTRTGNVFAAQQSEDGETWTDIVVSPALDIAMAANVYIGLAVCSHDTAIVTGAEFSNVSTTGNVTGAWQTAEIGIAQPAGNSSESMYVTIEDSAGKSATVVNADAAITVRPSWQEWAIPFSDLAGVNLSRVTKMVVGVGSKASPKAGGAGTVYVDDIGFGSPIAP
ncbi:MAG: LamG-like jellyroll fold domain-containing protein [Sedimentisphaerales bacterium]|nr:LamG-like jellyroll fold domain-containing protein [Sedimentisphaerales bacterium]